MRRKRSHIRMINLIIRLLRLMVLLSSSLLLLLSLTTTTTTFPCSFVNNNYRYSTSGVSSIVTAESTTTSSSSSHRASRTKTSTGKTKSSSSPPSWGTSSQQNNNSNKNNNHKSKKSSTTNNNKKRCLYDILGLNDENKKKEEYNEKDIKKAYRKMALKYHPDKQNGCEDTFKEISYAYEILSNPVKKQLYDLYGYPGIELSTSGSGGAGASSSFYPNGGRASPFYFGSSSNNVEGDISPEQLFQHFFSTTSSTNGQQHGTSSFFSFGNSGRKSNINNNDNNNNMNRNIDMNDILRDMMFGAAGSDNRNNRNQQKNDYHPFFDNTNTGPAREKSNNQGRSSTTPTYYERPIYCTLEELYFGKMKKLKVSMRSSSGGSSNNNNDQRSKIYNVPIKPGYKGGTKIKYPPSFKDNSPGMIFIIQEKQHPYFQRNGNDLIYKYKVPNNQNKSNNNNNNNNIISLEIPLLDGSIWKRTIPANSKLIKPGERIIIPDKGMPISSSSTKKKQQIRKNQDGSSSSSFMPNKHYYGNLIIEFS